MLDILNKGPREQNDHPSLDHYLSKLSGCKCEWCHSDLSAGEVKHYRHPSGLPLKGYKERQWIFIECPKCGYEWALWKLIKYQEVRI